MDFRLINNISINCVIFGFDSENRIRVLLTNRKLNMYNDDYPSINDWVLTGHHVMKSETLDESAQRIFYNATSLTNIYKRQFSSFGSPDRITSDMDLLWVRSKGFSQRTVTIAYYFLLPSQQVNINNNNLKWFSVDTLPTLGFDHNEIIEAALNHLREKIMVEPIIFELLPDKFTLNELQIVYESVLGITLDNRNFRKKAISKSYIVPLDEKRKGLSKKPANLFMFSKDVYDKVSSKNHIISI